MHDAPSTHASLVVRLRNADDEQAWTEFVNLYEPLVYRLVRSKGLQDADAREVTQDVLWAVSQAVDRWEPDPERGSFRGWLATIARNLTINFLSRPQWRIRGSGRTSVLTRLQDHPDASTAQTREFDLELRRRLFAYASERVRSQVQPTTWEAFWGTAVEDQPVRKIARELNLTTGAVYLARSRVMYRLRCEVERLTTEDD